MIVFVEGADGAGKTTLVKQLGKYYPTITVPRSADNLDLWVNLDVYTMNYHLVTDRSPISDYAYRLMDGEEGKYSMSQLLNLLKGNKVIYCRTPTQWEDAMARGEDNITDPSNAAIIDATYEFLMKLLNKEGVEIIEYNWKKDSLDELLAKIKTRRAKV